MSFSVLEVADKHAPAVLSMRPPNEHSAGVALPTRLSELLVLGKPGDATVFFKDDQKTYLRSCTGFLKKVEGVQSLQIELNWM